ncbi:MAG: substrate-binding domain-containing protein [Christensenella sp.]|nr:substrate-binding domain-containing protein [Christensenella sp.]
MKKRMLVVTVCLLLVVAMLAGCSTPAAESSAPAETPEATAAESAAVESSESPKESATTSTDADKAVSSDLKLGDYQPKKDEYNFYFTYKLVHPWWDSVGLGLKDAQEQYAAKGIKINYEYTAPVTPDATDQVSRLEQAAGRGFDVIGVDVNDIKIVTPTINNLIEQGVKVMTFSSSDATKEDGCKRIAYVGNTHNYQDGADLAEVLAEKIGYKGQVAALGGTIGAPCHDDRIKGFKDIMAKYPDIEVVEIQYDNDQVEQALTYAEGFLQKYPDLKGIFCNNMGNPIGAAQAVVDAGKQDDIVLVGMDHDLRALEYLRDGVISALGVQDCYKMGFDTIQTAIMIADGLEPGADTYPEQTEEQTTIIYPEGAQAMIDKLYPDEQ